MLLDLNYTLVENSEDTRTTKTFYSGATYAWKNGKNWWNSTHTKSNAVVSQSVV